MEHGREIEPSGTDLPSGVQGETADAFSTGELINGRYSVLIEISEGSSGKLYYARDVRTESDVTLKLLLGWPGLDDAVIRRLTADLETPSLSAAAVKLRVSTTRRKASMSSSRSMAKMS